VASERNLKAILDSIADGVFTVDHSWRITSFNRAAEKITGLTRRQAVGRTCSEVFRAAICETDCALRRTLETGRPIVNRRVDILAAGGRRVPISVSTAILRDERGRVAGGVETFRDLSLVEELRRELTRQHAFGDIISKNKQMQDLFAILPEIAASDSTVLIEGPSGSGKELFARAIHELSRRRRKRLVTVNCGALPDTLLESELFGYEAGAFTDAKRAKPGRFALAQGGTIFLDEIAEVSPALQVRLLRVLQEREFEPLGGTRPIKADVRVVAATNTALEELVAAGRFRRDLYYRINVVKLALPQLAARREDIPLLAEHFVSRFNRLQGKDITGLSGEALAVLMRHDFPGNVRELENVVEHAFVLCRGGQIEPQHLPGYVFGGVASAGRKTLEELEVRAIREALERNRWRRLATACELGIDKTTLWRKMRRFELCPDPGAPPPPRSPKTSKSR
jgi:PAS domain S-box-containing protein